MKRPENSDLLLWKLSVVRLEANIAALPTIAVPRAGRLDRRRGYLGKGGLPTIFRELFTAFSVKAWRIDKAGGDFLMIFGQVLSEYYAI